MATYIGCFTGKELSNFVQGASALAFEYGRLVLYRKELALLDGYVENQYLLDDQLQMKLDAYLNELKEESERFNDVIKNAFDTDIRSALAGSVELARLAGVEEKELLKSTTDIDEFFMN